MTAPPPPPTPLFFRPDSRPSSDPPVFIVSARWVDPREMLINLHQITPERWEINTFLSDAPPPSLPPAHASDRWRAANL